MVFINFVFFTRALHVQLLSDTLVNESTYQGEKSGGNTSANWHQSNINMSYSKERIVNKRCGESTTIDAHKINT